jgi:tryptophanase
VYTLSQLTYAVDRITWLYAHRRLVGGLKFVEEPKTLRFFLGRLAPLSDWPERLAEAFERDYAQL